MSILTDIAAAVQRKFRRDERGQAAETINPLRGVNSIQAQQIFDQARTGSYARLQFLYNEIERTDPTLLICVTRRAAALSELEWKVVRSDQRLNRNADEALVSAQTEFLETELAGCKNLPEAVEHLALAAFRGFSHILPRFVNGRLDHFDLPNSWNFCYDRAAQKWLWNPSASSWAEPRDGSDGMIAVPADERITIVDPRSIDWPALMIYLRSSVGETNWGRFLEQYGIPPVILTLPEGTSSEDADRYVDAAREIFVGNSGVVPAGTNVTYAGSDRGTNPFAEFLDHQQKLVVLMATGGLLTSLAESGSGTLAGDAHTQTWRQIARRDSRIISNAINKQLCERMIRRKFGPDAPILVEFSLDTEPIPSAKEVLELAGLAKAAGLAVDPEEISQRTGYKLTTAPEPMAAPFGMNAEAAEKPQEAPAEVVTNEDAGEAAEALEGSKSAVGKLTDAFTAAMAEAMAVAVEEEPES